MDQTKTGAAKMRETNIKKHGSEEAWREFMRENGRKGGKLGRTGGFAAGEAGRERARTAGRIGGRISRKGKVLINGEYFPKPVVEENEEPTAPEPKMSMWQRITHHA